MGNAGFRSGQELAKMNMHEFKTPAAKRLSKFGEVFGYLVMCIAALGAIICYYIGENSISWIFLCTALGGLLLNLLTHKIALMIDKRAGVHEDQEEKNVH